TRGYRHSNPISRRHEGCRCCVPPAGRNLERQQCYLPGRLRPRAAGKPLPYPELQMYVPRDTSPGRACGSGKATNSDDAAYILMADTKKSGLSFEWYVISKQAIYLFTVSIITIATLLSGGYCLYKTTRGPLNNSDQSGRKSARFIQIEGKVRVKRANETEFKAATEDVPLEAGDTIQTLSDSVARVQFIDGSSYTIKPDTTLVIKDNSLNADKSTRVQVAVGVGKINLATGEQGPGSSNVVQTQTASANIGSQTEASVDAGNKGENTEIRVARGTAKINTQAGKSYEVGANDKANVGSDGKVVIDKMPPLPELSAPENQRTIKIPAGRPGQVNFSWGGVPQAKSYRIEVATSAY